MIRIAYLPLLASLLLVVGVSPAGAEAGDAPRRILEFRYKAPEAGEVFLVWGIQGWQVLPEADRPPGTVVKNRVMNTPMTRGKGGFLAKVQMDPAVTVEYGFLVTRTHDGIELEIRPVWDGRKEFVVPPGETPAVVEAESVHRLFPPIGPRIILFGLFCLLSAVGIAFLIDFLLLRAQPGFRRIVVIIALIAIVEVGLGLRIGAAVLWNHEFPDSPDRLFGDEPDFNRMALQLLDGQGFTWPGRVPLYPSLLAGLLWISKGSYHAVPYFQALISMATIVFTYFLGKSIFGDRAGLVAAAWVSLSYVLIREPLRLQSEVLYTPVLLLSALALVHATREPAPMRSALAGALIGIANLVRPALLFFPLWLALPLPFLRERRRMVKCWAIFCAVSLLVVSPWILHNYMKHRAILPLQTSRAILWQGSPEYYHLVRDGGYTYLRIWKEILYGPGWERNDPESVEGDRYWTRRALRSILEEPTVYLRYAGEKLFTYWLGDPGADWGNRHIFSYAGLRQVGYSSYAAVQVIFARVLPIVALGILVFMRSLRSKSLPLLAILGYFTLLHALTHAEARLSEPLQPLLLIVIAGALITAMDHRKGHATDPA
ncbi:MAG: glycosyltransferase family 39 protein [Deltaproteobacteria bacterium]|nr:glycosyltransferase family 39 protein [Deltaproteobacteria bacterium]